MSDQNTTQKETGLTKVLNIISGGFAPIIGVLAGAGLLKAALSIFISADWLSSDSGTYIALSFHLLFPSYFSWNHNFLKTRCQWLCRWDNRWSAVNPRYH